jgi:hypothetical protein
MKSAWFIAVLLLAWISRTNASDEIVPSPAMSPADVVNFQLQALQHNDDPAPNSGIAKVFRFASPANREVTGPLDHFEQIIRSPAYAVLINARSSQIASTKVVANRAEVTVTVTSSLGKETGFTFILSKQMDGDFQGCWMTDSVLQVGSDQSTQPSDAIQI